MKNFYEEYKEFIEKYLLPLLGIPTRDVDIQSAVEDLVEGKYFDQKEDGYLYFYYEGFSIFKLQYFQVMSPDNIKLAKSILQVFFSVSKFKIGSQIQNKYYSISHQTKNYELAIERGICNWITGKKNDDIESLFRILEEWSVKTYEGKKVTLGFIINPNVGSEFSSKYGTFEKFLKDDFIAVFTDCVNSVIELDVDCNIIRYLSVTENKEVQKYSLDNQLPLRFANVIQNYTKNNCVGVFLLNNGDIILSKNQKIRLVKRNLHWLNFSYEAFHNAIANSTIILDEKLIKNLFASMVDVSFAHTGGIIAVVHDINSITRTDEELFPVLSPFDWLSNPLPLDEIENNIKIKNKSLDTYKKHLVLRPEEINKRLLKRDIILKLIDNKNFIQLDRKLKCELISLDGACILDRSGNVCACGAIIKNDSGSSGGGRRAAAKKLSSYGLAIKISTDGYIELYINGNLKYSIK